MSTTQQKRQQLTIKLEHKILVEIATKKQTTIPIPAKEKLEEREVFFTLEDKSNPKKYIAGRTFFEPKEGDKTNELELKILTKIRL